MRINLRVHREGLTVSLLRYEWVDRVQLYTTLRAHTFPTLGAARNGFARLSQRVERACDRAYWGRKGPPGD